MVTLPSIEDLTVGTTADQVAKADLVVLRLHKADAYRAEEWAEIKRASAAPLIAWLPDASTSDTYRICRLGADAVVTDGCSLEERSLALDLALSSRGLPDEGGDAMQREDELPSLGMVGSSDSVRVLGRLVRLVGPRRCTVLITGETGVGKEVLARAIHAASPRRAQRMVSVNCSAIPGELLEAELFGHVKGAFTGAHLNRIGRFEQADRGTLFLDEVGDLPLALQAKLLRVLQEREFERLGSSETVSVDVRIIAATNANLMSLVEQGKFRPDLYYRFNVAPIDVPPLRERLGDVPELVHWFVRRICLHEQIPAKSVPNEVTEWLSTFAWPGNIRELENAIESAIALSGDRPVLRMSDFPGLLCSSPRQPRLFALPEEGVDFNRVVSQFERSLLTEALRLTSGNKKAAAGLLQLKRSTLLAKLVALGIGNDEIGEKEDSVEQGTAA